MKTSPIEENSRLPIWKMLLGEAVICLVACLAAMYIPSWREDLVFVASLALMYFVFHLPLLILRSKDYVPEDEPTGSMYNYYFWFSLFAATFLGAFIGQIILPLVS